MNRTYRLKISRETDNLNNIISQLDQMDTCQYSTQSKENGHMEHLFPSAHRILSKTEHFLRKQLTTNIMKMSERTCD